MNNQDKPQQILTKCQQDYVDLFNFCQTPNNLTVNQDARYTAKLERRLYNNIKQLVSTDLGIELLTAVLDGDDHILSAMAAAYLYPLYPDKSIQALRRLNDFADSVFVVKNNAYIDGLMSSNQYLLDYLQQLYGKERFDKLSKLKT